MGLRLYLFGKMSEEEFEQITYEKKIQDLLNKHCEVMRMKGDDGLIRITHENLKSMKIDAKSFRTLKNQDEAMRVDEFLEHLDDTFSMRGTDELYFYWV